jgi:hypothetical protein
LAETTVGGLAMLANKLNHDCGQPKRLNGHGFKSASVIGTCRLIERARMQSPQRVSDLSASLRQVPSQSIGPADTLFQF